MISPVSHVIRGTISARWYESVTSVCESCEGWDTFKLIRDYMSDQVGHILDQVRDSKPGDFAYVPIGCKL